jgi:hypothetical protein
VKELAIGRDTATTTTTTTTTNNNNNNNLKIQLKNMCPKTDPYEKKTAL